MSDKIKKHEGDVKNAKECSDAWQKCLKTREEKKDSLYKEIKSKFIPCVIKKNTKMFHRCLVCFRETEACSFKKKQDVAILAIREKLFKQQLEMVNNEIKDVEKSLEFIKKIDQECSKIKEGEGYAKKISKKIEAIQYVKKKMDKMKMDKDLPANFDVFRDQQLKEDDMWTTKWDQFAVTADHKEILKFNQDIEHFYNANKKISNDLDSVFLEQVKKRCKILRAYDEGGWNLLKSLEKEAKSLEKEAFSFKIEACRMAYEKERDEYKKSISTVESNYNKAIEIFAKISKSPELNCLERNCIKKYSCDTCKNTGTCSAVKQERECYEIWECINADQIKFQQGTLCELGESVDYAKLKERYCELNTKENFYGKNSQCHLDHWEASIPDGVWMNILQYEEASNIFDSIKDSIVSIKDGIIFKKEADVAIAVQALSGVLYFAEQKKRDHKKFFIQHAYAVIKEQVAHVEKNKDERMKICLRGEANTFVGQDLYWVIPEMIETRSRPICDPKKKEYLEKDPYSIVDASNLDDFQDFDCRFKISRNLRGKSCIDMCNFLLLCKPSCSCVDNDHYGDLKCDDEPCCPQPSCCGQEAGQTCGQQDDGNRQAGQHKGTESEPADGDPVDETL